MSVYFINEPVPKQLTISEFNEIVKSCNLSKHKSLSLARSLRKNNLLEKAVTNRKIKNRDEVYRPFLIQQQMEHFALMSEVNTLS